MEGGSERGRRRSPRNPKNSHVEEGITEGGVISSSGFITWTDGYRGPIHVGMPRGRHWVLITCLSPYTEHKHFLSHWSEFKARPMDKQPFLVGRRGAADGIIGSHVFPLNAARYGRNYHWSSKRWISQLGY